jgi:bifunctional DNA-binding transcriptional regulator/antitoxin component of YhaV-PrlF toxin-antitoxin module
VTGHRLRFDAKRRPTLPSALLEEAGIDTSHEVVAYVDGPGRIVLEDPLVLLAAFQAEVAKELAETGYQGDLSHELIAERATDGLSG